MLKDRLPHGYGEHDGRLDTLRLKTTLRAVNTINPRDIGRWFVGNNDTQKSYSSHSLDDHTPGNSVFHFSPDHSVQIACNNEWQSIGRILEHGEWYDLYALHYDPSKREKHPSFDSYLRRIGKR